MVTINSFFLPTNPPLPRPFLHTRLFSLSSPFVTRKPPPRPSPPFFSISFNFLLAKKKSFCVSDLVSNVIEQAEIAKIAGPFFP